MKQELRPPSVMARQFWLFNILEIISNGLTAIFVYPYVDNFFWIGMQLVLFVLVFILLLFSKNDPGYLIENKKSDERLL